jgi:hypothetical protein
MEIWKEVKHYYKFEVSNKGNVRRKENPDIYIKEFDTNGYRGVYLKSYGKGKSLLVHKLVAQAFIENPNTKNCVIHKDWNKSNNVVENLEWATFSESIIHAYKRVDGIRHSNQAKLSKQDIMDVYEMTKTHDKIEVAKKYRITLKKIDLIIRLKSKNDE